MWSKWECTDPDCHQHIRKDNTQYELIQVVWLDTTQEDKQKGMKEYIVVRDKVCLPETEVDDIVGCISSYGYTLFDIIKEYGEGALDLIAECLLEESCLKGVCIVGVADSYDEAKNMVDKIINGG